MPASRLEKAQATDGVPYDIFVRKGVLVLSGENHVDYRDVYQFFVDLQQVHEIYALKIGDDRYSAQYLIDDLKAYGYQTDDVFQGENLAPVIREFEGIIKDRKFKIADNALLQAHLLNVALKHNMETRKVPPGKDRTAGQNRRLCFRDPRTDRPAEDTMRKLESCCKTRLNEKAHSAGNGL